jgi:hypothetical protein
MFSSKDVYKIFISYERKDAGGWAGSIYQYLRNCYDEGMVFKDLEETRGGTLWDSRLTRLVRQCEAFLVIIGLDWMDSRVLEKLRDPNAPIHSEIVAAVEAGKIIIPVVVEGAQVPSIKEGVPDKIDQAINRPHRVQLRTSSTFWVQDLEQLCTDIQAQTGIIWSRPSARTHMAVSEQLLCRLNRYTELGSAKQGFVGGHQLFLARGVRKAGFRYFALRCALDVVTSGPQAATEASGQATPRYERLPWGQFSETEDARIRRALLLREIARCVFAEAQGRQENETEPWLKSRIQMNTRPTVVFSAVSRHAAADTPRIREWFEIWRDLLSADQRRSIAVVLFVELGRWPWTGWSVPSPDPHGFEIRPALGKVRRSHVEEWLEGEVRRQGDEQLIRKLQDVRSRLYRFRRGCHFEDICEMMRSPMG